MSHIAPFKLSKSKLTIAILCATLSIGGAMSINNLPAFSQDAKMDEPMRQMPASSVLKAVRQDMAQRFGIQRINIKSFSEQNWPDGCLGLPRGKEGCTSAIVPGWQILVSDKLQTWTYRTDTTGNILRLENPNRVVLPQSTAKKLIQWIAKETRIAPSNFTITEVKSAEFNGCLGIYEGPRQKCTEILIYGWKVIVTSPAQSSVYHLDRNATRIIRNTTASGAKPKIRVSFETFGSISPIASNIIFSSKTSGDLTGRMSNTVLTEDGKIILYQSSPTAKLAPQQIKTLSPEQINTFKKSLENQKFPNLNGLTYLTSASLADYPTTTYQAQLTSVQLIDLEKENLPRSLQRIVSTWQTLIQK